MYLSHDDRGLGRKFRIKKGVRRITRPIAKITRPIRRALVKITPKPFRPAVQLITRAGIPTKEMIRKPRKLFAAEQERGERVAAADQEAWERASAREEENRIRYEQEAWKRAAQPEPGRWERGPSEPEPIVPEFEPSSPFPIRGAPSPEAPREIRMETPFPVTEPYPSEAEIPSIPEMEAPTLIPEAPPSPPYIPEEEAPFPKPHMAPPFGLPIEPLSFGFSQDWQEEEIQRLYQPAETPIQAIIQIPEAIKRFRESQNPFKWVLPLAAGVVLIAGVTAWRRER